MTHSKDKQMKNIFKIIIIITILIIIIYNLKEREALQINKSDTQAEQKEPKEKKFIHQF
jgi:ATP/ADP translocase